MNILKKPKDNIPLIEGRYEKLNLKENPFPTSPTINKGSSDNRYNGKIYEDKIRASELKKIEDKFLKSPQTNPNHFRLGYIMDESYIGRGNGKSAFSLNLLERINEDYCLDISEGVNKCFGIYLSPEPSGRTKSFYNFIDLFFESILESNILAYCLASLRLAAIIELDRTFDVDSEFSSLDDLILKLNSREWFAERTYTLSDVAHQIFSSEHLVELSKDFPLSKDKSNFFLANPVNQNHFKDYYLSLKKGKERLHFIFDDLVSFFLASGFNGNYVIVDDFERIPDFQSDRQRREFAQELRANLFDNVSKNAKIGFYNFIFVLHAGVHRLIEKAWAESGMEQRSPLSSANHGSGHIIKFSKLTNDHAVLLLEKYLSEYRIEKNTNKIKPFDEDAIELISEKSKLNAAKILQKAHQLIEKAVDKDVTKIDKQLVEEVFGELEEIQKTYDDIADEKSTNLLDKAKEE